MVPLVAAVAVRSPIAGPRTEAQWQDYLGALDFAGGTVVHLASGVAALVLSQ